MSSTANTVDDLDPWQLRCPEGHTCWEPVNGGFWCSSCSQSDGFERDAYEYVIDVKSGDRLDREDVRRLEEAAKRQEHQQKKARGD